jgi:hypothetical protein
MQALFKNRASRAGDPFISAINGLLDLRENLRDMAEMFEDFGGNWMADALAQTMGTIPVVNRARAEGLSSGEARAWVEAVQGRAGHAEESCIVSYVQACRKWEQHLDRNIGSMAADPDWDMGSAQRVGPSVPEATIAGKGGYTDAVPSWRIAAWWA